MVRVTRPQPGKQNGPSANNRSTQVSKNRRKQKIVLEKNDQDDKKLRTVVRKRKLTARGHAHRANQVSFRADPPQGYTFIPLGNPQLTTALKKAALDSNQKIFAVSVG